DDSMRSWVIQGSSLYEAQIPSNSLGIRSSTDLLNVSDSCFGLALSPGNLVVAVVRGLDTDLLNQMYQARSQKAAVEFFWIGGQQLGSSSDRNLELGVETIPGISEREMTCWESNIMWSLKQYEHLDNLLVVWDVIAALFAVEYSAQSYVQRILAKWLSSWFAGCDMGCSIEKILFYATRCLYKISTRQLHLLNIICRRFVLSGLKGDMHNVQAKKLEGVNVEDEQVKLWIDILNVSERELRERLVAFSFAFVLSQASSSTTIIPIDGQWFPVGIAQMEQWVAKNHDSVQDNLKILASKIEKLGKSL
ncbi:Transducin/WD40 repeat-like superfamily protein, partial [Thalictrum thalictroides]